MAWKDGIGPWGAMVTVPPWVGALLFSGTFGLFLLLLGEAVAAGTLAAWGLGFRCNGDGVSSLHDWNT